MKLSTVIVAAALAIPAVSSFAQTQPVTRAQVEAQQTQLEQAGYSKGADSTTYPAQLQAAEAKISAQNSQSSVGGSADGSSSSGTYHAVVSNNTNLKPTYFGH